MPCRFQNHPDYIHKDFAGILIGIAPNLHGLHCIKRIWTWHLYHVEPSYPWTPYVSPFVWSLMSVFRVLEFSVYKFCTCFVRLCPSISFWINFKFSFKLCFWTCSLLVYRKTLDFCMLLFSLAAFLNLLINCTLFLLVSVVSVRNLQCLNSFPLHVSVGSLSLLSRFSLCF